MSVTSWPYRASLEGVSGRQVLTFDAESLHGTIKMLAAVNTVASTEKKNHLVIHAHA